MMRLLNNHLIRVVSAAERERSATRRGSEQCGVGSDERGQVLVIGVIVIIGLTMIAIAVANVGIMVAEKMHVQDTVDAAAYSAATVEARYMNLAAYINRAMVANYDVMAFNTALWAVADADDHGLAVITAMIYEIAFVVFVIPFTTEFAPAIDGLGDGFREIHHVAHEFNKLMNQLFAQDDDAMDLNQYVEMMNIDLLTTYSGLLYAALQSSRHTVARDVAAQMDPDVLTTSVLGLGAEAVSYDELARAVDWVIRDTDARGAPWKQLNESFNKMAGEDSDTDDHPLYLAATTEASLDPFAAGLDRKGDKDILRNIPPVTDIIPGADIIEGIMDFECGVECVGTFGLGDCDCDARFELSIGPVARWAQETEADQDHVPAIARRRMREVEKFGIDVDVHPEGLVAGLAAEGLKAIVGGGGHTSGDAWNDVCNVANFFEVKQFLENAEASCMYPTGLNSGNISQAMAMLVIPPIWVDDHWDGTLDVRPDHQFEPIPMGAGVPDSIDYASQVMSDSDKLEEGVPKYDWQVDVDNVGFPLYTYPDTGAQTRAAGTSAGGVNNVLAGPSVAVVGVKSKDKIRGIQGLGIGNDYSITAMARAQVYYLRSFNRPEEKPNLFNPHWVPRLAPIESEDTPALLRKGLPFVGSIGIPIAPTH